MMFAIDTAPAYRVQVDASAAPEVVEMAAGGSDQRVRRPCGPTRTTAAPPATSDWPVPSERIGPWWRVRKCSTGVGAGRTAIVVRGAACQPPARRWYPAGSRTAGGLFCPGYRPGGAPGGGRGGTPGALRFGAPSCFRPLATLRSPVLPPLPC